MSGDGDLTVADSGGGTGTVDLSDATTTAWNGDLVMTAGFVAAASMSNLGMGAMVFDGCFASVTSMVYGQAAERHIPSFLVDIFLPGVRLGSFVFFGYREVDPIGVVATVKAPVFFIHEEKDNLTTLAQTQLLLDGATNPYDTIWEIPAALHSQGYRSDPAEFVNRVSVFFEANLVAKSP